MAGLHPLAVEPVAQVEADRERVVADLAVEPAIDAAADALRRGDRDGGEVVLTEDAPSLRGRGPPTPRQRRAGTRTRA